MTCAFSERPKPCGECTLCQLRAAREEVAVLKARVAELEELAKNVQELSLGSPPVPGP